MDIVLHPIAFVRNTRLIPEDDNWGDVISEIILDEVIPEESLENIEMFSHAEVLFYFHAAASQGNIRMSRHPRGNKSWPKMGVFAQRNKDRPNFIGLSIVKIIRHEGRSLFVQGLDAIDGTPVLDIKPVMANFLPREPLRQPQWSHELMRNYWDGVAE
jgi:tRNA-Thr(GGU) m(6)t(6)A37 methyltransferase TsaA